jgi:hypothetical protein
MPTGLRAAAAAAGMVGTSAIVLYSEATARQLLQNQALLKQ